MATLGPFAVPEETLQSLIEKHLDSYRVPKIPAFFQEDPQLWFIQVESALTAARVTSQKTMADIVVASLSYDQIASVRDILTASPQPPDLYEQIKTRIISSFSTSAEARLRRLLKGEVLTEGKPSQILTRLRNLNDGSFNNDVISTIFLEQLPAQVRAILAMSRITDPHEFAELADKVMEASGSAIVSVSSAPSCVPDAAALAVSSAPLRLSSHRELKEKVNALAKQVADLANAVRRMSRDVRRRTPSRGRSGSRPRTREDPLCHFHRKFGKDARNCAKPCAWKPEN
ncbi:hypothetical protein WN55_04310 [Dufourea novaeangliae]|uniref:DUF7041 domain-containing protein n=1 Tax=Dufourea novaeangliae TaxID=178035 RepID=A0A154PL01_DUFNO|nr:hypothetical protein WN55_04310 [Dufourea novaeangliae]